MYALIDCNNFFASCEKIFNPSLEGKPLVVLSNNDGCAIARSNEAKALGIPMGAPYFKFKELIEKNNVSVFSSNYELYGDISNRVMSVIAHLAKDYEIYSIDEAFVCLKSIPHTELPAYIYEIRSTIFKWIGIKVSIGIGPSKTLAKVANHIAKKHPLLCFYDGIFDIGDSNTQTMILKNLKLMDIWGVSYGYAQRLQSMGIENAMQLRDYDSKVLRKSFGVGMEKIVLELRGISCIGLENQITANKNIISSRSFGRDVTRVEELEEAIASYTARACVKMRVQGTRASGIYVFLKSNKFKAGNMPYKYVSSRIFTSTISDTSYLITVAKELLNKIYIKGIQYKKAGIMLIDLKANGYEQKSFFEETEAFKLHSDDIMNIIDKTNKRFGRGALSFAAEGIRKDWQMKREKKSPSYTTVLLTNYRQAIIFYDIIPRKRYYYEEFM